MWMYHAVFKFQYDRASGPITIRAADEYCNSLAMVDAVVEVNEP